MTLKQELEGEGVLVEKCDFNASAWAIATPMSKDGFKRFAKKAGWAYHHDKVDQLVSETMKAELKVKYNLPDSAFVKAQGGYMVDQEAYFTSLGAVIFMVLMKGE